MDHQPNFLVIGLHGLPGVGKDTAADFLVREHEFIRRGFADPLYEEVAEAFGVSVTFLRTREVKETPQRAMALGFCSEEAFVEMMFKREGYNFVGAHSPREILRLWGTEYRRAQRDDYWIRQMDDFRIMAAVEAKAGLVIPDVRFENEAEWLFGVEGKLIEIRRPGCVGSGHQSDLPIAKIDYTIINDKSIEALEQQVDAVFHDIASRAEW